MVDDTLKPCSWNGSGYTRILIAEFSIYISSLLLFVLLSSLYHRLQRTRFLLPVVSLPSRDFLRLILLLRYACSTRPLCLFTLLQDLSEDILLFLTYATCEHTVTHLDQTRASLLTTPARGPICVVIDA